MPYRYFSSLCRGDARRQYRSKMASDVSGPAEAAMRERADEKRARRASWAQPLTGVASSASHATESAVDGVATEGGDYTPYAEHVRSGTKRNAVVSRELLRGPISRQILYESVRSVLATGGALRPRMATPAILPRFGSCRSAGTANRSLIRLPKMCAALDTDDGIMSSIEC